MDLFSFCDSVRCSRTRCEVSPARAEGFSRWKGEGGLADETLCSRGCPLGRAPLVVPICFGEDEHEHEYEHEYERVYEHEREHGDGHEFEHEHEDEDEWGHVPCRVRGRR